MDRVVAIFKTIKFWAAIIGAGATAAGGVAGAPAWLLAIGSVATGIAVWEIPYQPAPTKEVGHGDPTRG